MKIEVIKNKFFDLESVLKGERKNIYNKDAYAFLECKDDKDNIASLKYHIVNSIKFAFVSAEDTFKRLSNLKINVKDFIKE
ncbi:hypothetical protein [Campylobacter coli]|uniref:hypothetical protein n=1 Tax=Campylobacter coli TaxID=195 RepID=UPI000930C0A1|nr:hypothetical protein [Campylobacter coli]